jgi:hypothetical protein
VKRKYEEVLPVGYIIVGADRYMVLHPEPLNTRDAWANGMLQFTVAKSGDYLDWIEYGDGLVYTYSRRVLVVHPQNMVMEIGYTGKPILVWTGEWEIETSMVETDPEEVGNALLLLDEEEEWK